MKKIKLLFLGLTSLVAYAQEEEEKVTLKPTGRMFLDAAYMKANSYQDKLIGGVTIPDVRIGVEANYKQWEAKVELAYAYGSISPKDVSVQYVFNDKTHLKAGYFRHQFGLQSTTGSSSKITMEEPISNELFSYSRLVGLMFVHSAKAYFGTLSVFTESEMIKQNTAETGSQAIGMMTRQLYRPLQNEGNIFHIGLSAAFQTPEYHTEITKNHSAYSFEADFPTRVAKVTAQAAEVTDAKMLYKFTPELLFAKSTWALEAQYYQLFVQRKSGVADFKASGFYAILRTVLKGSPYSYTSSDSAITTPKAGSMELAAAYDYANLSNTQAGVLGGRSNDYSLAFNYYLNRYITWRVRASHTAVNYRANSENTSLNLLETRLQIKF